VATCHPATGANLREGAVNDGHGAVVGRGSDGPGLSSRTASVSRNVDFAAAQNEDAVFASFLIYGFDTPRCLAYSDFVISRGVVSGHFFTGELHAISYGGFQGLNLASNQRVGLGGSEVGS
jgi:hypothetical protein